MANKKRSKGPSTGGSFPISLVMIVRDEEHVLGRCLESVQGLVDEIVVVDTGSTDRTVEIATSYGARVAHFTWVDDFSAARNHALSLARHPWRLVLDADEWIADREGAAVALATARRTVPSYIGLLGMRQLSEATGELHDTVPFPLPRLLPRQVSYTGRVHEQVTPMLQLRSLDVLLGHDGYTAAANARKDGRNIALLEAALPEDPTNAYLWFQLGSDHVAHHRYQEALPYLTNAYNLSHPDGRAVSEPQHWWHLNVVRLMLALTMVEQWDEAVALGEQEAETWAASSDFFYVLGLAVHGLGRSLLADDLARADSLLGSALGCWINAVELGDREVYTGALSRRGTVLAAERLADTYARLGQTQDAERYAAIAGALVASA